MQIIAACYCYLSYLPTSSLSSWLECKFHRKDDQLWSLFLPEHLAGHSTCTRMTNVTAQNTWPNDALSVLSPQLGWSGLAMAPQPLFYQRLSTLVPGAFGCLVLQSSSPLPMCHEIVTAQVCTLCTLTLCACALHTEEEDVDNFTPTASFPLLAGLRAVGGLDDDELPPSLCPGML